MTVPLTYTYTHVYIYIYTDAWRGEGLLGLHGNHGVVTTNNTTMIANPKPATNAAREI